MAAKWVPIELRQQAELSGATVVDRSSVIITHLDEVVRQHAGWLLGREDVRALLDIVKRTHPVVVEELTPALLTTRRGAARAAGAARRAGADPRPGPHLRGAVPAGEGLDRPGRPRRVGSRSRSVPAIAAVHARGGLLQVLTLDPMVEQQLVESVRPGDLGAGLSLPPGMVERLVDSAASRLRAAEDLGHSPVLVCAAPLRAPLSRLLRTSSSRLPVLSYAEIDPSLRIETLGVIAHADALVA